MSRKVVVKLWELLHDSVFPDTYDWDIDKICRELYLSRKDGADLWLALDGKETINDKCDPQVFVDTLFEEMEEGQWESKDLFVIHMFTKNVCRAIASKEKYGSNNE